MRPFADRVVLSKVRRSEIGGESLVLGSLACLLLLSYLDVVVLYLFTDLVDGSKHVCIPKCRLPLTNKPLALIHLRLHSEEIFYLLGLSLQLLLAQLEPYFWLQLIKLR